MLEYTGVPCTAQLPSIASSIASHGYYFVTHSTDDRAIPIHMKADMTGKIQNEMIHIITTPCSLTL